MYESPSAIVQAVPGQKLHPERWISAIKSAALLLRSIVPVVQEAEAVRHAETATNRRQERGDRVGADFDDVVRLEINIRLFAGCDLFKIDAGNNLLVVLDAAAN